MSIAIKNIALSFILVASLSASSLVVAEQKVATVDIPKIVETLAKNSSAGQALEKRSGQEKNKLLTKKAELEKLEQGLKDKGIKADSPEAEAFRQKVREYQRTLSETEESLSKDYVKIQKETIDKIKTAVAKIAKEEGFTLVLTKSEAVPTAVLYSDNTLDITKKVLDSLN